MGISLLNTFLLVLAGIIVSSRAQDTCPDVKLIGVGESERMAIVRGCPGSSGSPGSKGEPGEQGIKGHPGITGKMGPPGEKGEVGPLGPPGSTGKQGEKGDSALGPSAAKNCMELLNNGASLTGWYTVYTDGNKPINVLCDMDTDGGGWIVFQRRVDGSVDFYRDWKSYKQGFGSQLSEFWLGNENIHLLTSSGNFQLRFDLEDFDNNRTYATYSKFRLEGESQKYTLRYGEFTGGPAGDSLSIHQNRAFSTKDADNDKSDSTNCATKYSGAWWYHSCLNTNPNGPYLRGTISKKNIGMTWYKFRGSYYSLKVTEIKFRPVE
ncbi:hypothetical protein XENTR_v10020012 [Xenopus tropicalis]|uniref:Ficolin 3 precursor n=1 Tax=Xenopus tropicalis TaxID=8364 RepID=Q5M8W6_XENTR|eukprot:NP_001011233.1 ficolin (collagen/fibrinogen domain containing) 3 precursor [Xenopus tropicalis]